MMRQNVMRCDVNELHDYYYLKADRIPRETELIERFKRTSSFSSISPDTLPFLLNPNQMPPVSTSLSNHLLLAGLLSLQTQP